MHKVAHIPSYLCVVLLFVATVHGGASAEIMQRIQSGIDSVARGMDYVGDRTGQLLGPGLPLTEGTGTAFTHERVIEEQYPCGASPIVALSNEFGEVRVNAWNERLVTIRADIIAGAETEQAAQQVAQLIELRIAHGADYLECRTVLPEIQGGDEVSITVNYTVLVPREAGLVVDNFFGDVRLADIGGMVVADVRYGALEMEQIQGVARVRVQGEFPVHVQGLHQGGVFRLQGARAEFIDVHGDLDISHFRGRVTVRQPGPQLKLNVTGDSGRVHIVLPPHSIPDFMATLFYSRLDSDLDVARTLRGAYLLARHPNVEAEQRITIDATFSEVVVAVQGSTSETSTTTGREHKAFTDTRTESIETVSGDTVTIEAMSGNIQVEGADTDYILVEATRVVSTLSPAAAMDALDALSLSVERTDGGIRIETRATQEMSIFDCDAYRVDLRVQCPREIPVVIRAHEGLTRAEGLGAGIAIHQQKGDISLEHIKGDIDVVNEHGAFTARECSGPIESTTRQGEVMLEQIYGDIRAQITEGRTHIDAPRGNVYIRHISGDVRFLSLETLQGNLDIFVEDGNISAFIAPESDAALSIKADKGRIQSSVPLSGSINRDIQEFFGRLNAETHTVRLETVNGDIFLN